MTPAPMTPQREDEPTDEQLVEYGYAPGGYMGRCLSCNSTTLNVDKRATSCRGCAVRRFQDVARAVAKIQALPPQPTGAQFDDRCLSRQFGGENCVEKCRDPKDCSAVRVQPTGDVEGLSEEDRKVVDSFRAKPPIQHPLLAIIDRQSAALRSANSRLAQSATETWNEAIEAAAKEVDRSSQLSYYADEIRALRRGQTNSGRSSAQTPAIEHLRKAIEPFATLGRQLNEAGKEAWPDGASASRLRMEGIVAGDFRRAAAALSTVAGEEK